MDDNLPPGSLHPNIARIAASYDMIIEQMTQGRLTPAQARAQIEQLEARDDQGVRWSIDPDTGEWIRKTLMGDTQFDTPPAYGYATDDAYSYSSTRGSEFDPNMRVEMFNAPNENLTRAPRDLAGATRNLPTQQPRFSVGNLGPWLAAQPREYKLVATVLLVLIVLGIIAL